jgi:hypothetical protein
MPLRASLNFKGIIHLFNFKGIIQLMDTFFQVVRPPSRFILTGRLDLFILKELEFT